MTTKRIEDNENGQPSGHVHVGDDTTDVEGHGISTKHRTAAPSTAPTAAVKHRSESRDDDVEGHTAVSKH